MNSVDEKQLADIIYLHSGEKKSRRIARAIMRNVSKGKMTTTQDLRESIEKAVGRKYLIKSLSRVFQAIRIHVNDEIESLKNLVSPWLVPDGKNHSVELV